MAYVEIWKNNKLVTRRQVVGEKAQKGCRLRLGAAGNIQIALGEVKQVGDLEVRMVEELPVKERKADKEAACDFSGNQVRPQDGIPASYPEIEGYEITGPLGKGGMGIVWRAVQLSTQREVALKLLAENRFGSPRAQARFTREVELTARLEHPNIARVYDSGLHHGMYHYAMELIDGQILDTYIQSHHLNRHEILKLLRRVCRAIQFAHQRGVIHRDLKPSNIIVTPDGEPHVVDFGLAKSFLKEDSEEITVSIEGEVAGTPAYMAPEQAAGLTEKMDTRTDVYSLGVILYKQVTGEFPHEMTGTSYEVVRRIAEEEPRRPRSVAGDIDRELEALLLKSLSHDQQERYRSAGELADDIENYLQGEPLRAKTPTTWYFLRKKVRKYRLQVSLAAIIFLLLSGTALVAYTSVIESRGRVKAAQEELQIQARAAELALSDSELQKIRADEAWAQKRFAELEMKILGKNQQEARAALRTLQQDYNSTLQETGRLKKLTEQILNSKIPEEPDEIVFVEIPAGTFQMGDHFKEGGARELPVHTVTLDAFRVSKYEITNAQYARFLNTANTDGLIKVVNGMVYASTDSSNNHPYFATTSFPMRDRGAPNCSQIDYRDGVFRVRTKSGYDMAKHPVVALNWYGAKAFCDYYGYRLPTEAEWEYAARGGQYNPYYRFPWGDTISHNQANYKGTGDYAYDVSVRKGYHVKYDYGIRPYNAPVGSFGPENKFGLHDMIGNVSEWCYDGYGDYPAGPVINPTGPGSGDGHIVRGGCGYLDAKQCRLSNRARIGQKVWLRSYIGFRPAASSKISNVHNPNKLTSADNNTTAKTSESEGPAGIVLITIPGGTFQMGDHHDGLKNAPVHAVTLDSFRLSKYEITNGQYAQYLNKALAEALIKVVDGLPYPSTDGSNSQPFFTDLKSIRSNIQIEYRQGTFRVKAKSGRNMSNDPVVYLTWYGAKAFCDYYGLRLPTEAEWEYAARGGQYNPYYRFPWGNTISHSQANYQSSNMNTSRKRDVEYDDNPANGPHPKYNDGIQPFTAPVGSFPPNGYGVYDMIGNSSEWCNDWLDFGYYSVSPANNPAGPAATNNNSRVLRGGGWYSPTVLCRVAYRSGTQPASRPCMTGFRPAMNTN